MIYRINSMIVNGDELIENKVKTYLTNLRKEELNTQPFCEIYQDIFDQEKEYRKDDIFNENENANAQIWLAKRIRLRQIKTSDDIVRYAHEMGHIIRGPEDLKTREVGKIMLKLPNKVYDNWKNRIYMNSQRISGIDLGLIINPLKDEDEIRQWYRKCLYEERRASIKGLEFLKKHSQIFPNDPDLNDARSLNVLALGRNINNFCSQDKSLIDSVRGEVEVLLDLNQN